MTDWPDLARIEDARVRLGARIVETPVVSLRAARIAPCLPQGVEAVMKLELFQQAGSFKARGALLNIDALDVHARARGVTTVSAGNHALALSHAARAGGVSAKMVMPKTADPVRVAGCRALGAEVVLCESVEDAFAEVERVVETEGRTLVHPFENSVTILGTATCGLEFARQAPDLDVLIVPVGGGGLIAGMARAMKLVQPDCRVVGVEPEGADAMRRSLAAGRPVRLDRVRTIADSLGAPMALPYSFGCVAAHVDQMVLIPDDAMLAATALIFDALKLAVEPAGAASTAAMIGPLRESLREKRVGVIACGANIGEAAFAQNVTEGRKLLSAAR